MAARLAAVAAGSRTFDERAAQLSEAYRAARVAQIVGARDYAPLFNGMLEERGRKGHRITYAWADPRELADWLVQGEVPKERSGPTVSAGLLKVSDQLLHVARWVRDVAVTMEVQPTSRKRPNVNISVADDGAGNSFLVGFGYWPPQAKGGKLAVDAAAAVRIPREVFDRLHRLRFGQTAPDGYDPSLGHGCRLQPDYILGLCIEVTH